MGLRFLSTLVVEVTLGMGTTSAKFHTGGRYPSLHRLHTEAARKALSSRRSQLDIESGPTTFLVLILTCWFYLP